MTWIPYVDPDTAEGELAEIYRGFKGDIDHVVQAHSLLPKAMKALLQFYRGVMHGKLDLSMTERETIAVTVSQVNECYY